jgi:DNA-binding FadR family transcriptional regulator
VRLRALGHAEITARLGAEILSGARKPGSRLPSVEEMNATFGVSRVLLREVTKTLAAKGLVSSKTRVGTRVLEPVHWAWLDPDVLRWRMADGLDATLLRQIGEVRRAVEPAAAALAALHRSRTALAQIRAALKAMEEGAGDRPRYARADMAFHVAVSDASGNPLFRAFTAVVDVAMAGFLAVTTDQVADREDFVASIALHRAVAEAIAARDPHAARRAMLRVVDVGIRDVNTRRRRAGLKT